MLTMGSYVWYVERRGMRRYLLVLLFFALGLMAKPMLVTLPFVLLLLDYWPLGRFHIRYVDDVQHTEDVSTKDTRRKKGKPRYAAENALQADNNTTSNYRWSLVLPLLREKIPFLILAAVSSIVTFYVQQGGGAVGSLYAFSVYYSGFPMPLLHILVISKRCSGPNTWHSCIPTCWQDGRLQGPV